MLNSAEFECVFRHCDVDGDGKVSAKELQHCVKMVCGDISQEELYDVISSLDSDGDGLLGLEDFAGVVDSRGEEEKIKDLKEAFGMYAIDESEGITPRSLRLMLSKLGESRALDECGLMISKFDLNGDGMLNFDEFMVMMQCYRV